MIWALAIVAVAFVAILVLGRTLATERGSKAKDKAEIVARVNGEGILKQRFESYKQGFALGGIPMDDEEILDRMITQTVISQEIARLGITVTEREVEEYNNQRFSLLNSDEGAAAVIQEYIDSKGITMEQYKAQSKEISRIALLSDRLREKLMTEFNMDNNDSQSFSQYFEEYVQALKDKAVVERVSE